MNNGFRSVSVIGTGIVKFGKFKDLPVPTLARPTIIDALREAQLLPKRIEKQFIPDRQYPGGWLGSA